MARPSKAKTAKRAATAYHEAGHTVAAFVQGMGIHHVTIIPFAVYDGLTRTHAPGIKRLDCEKLSPRRAERIRKQTRFSLAGDIAQRRFNPRSVRSRHAEKDRHNALEWTELLTHGDTDEAASLIESLGSETEKLIDTHWPEVTAIAEALMQRDTLIGSEVRAIIERLAPDFTT